MKKKINIIIDGNFIFHQNFAVYVGWNSTNAFPTERDEVSFIQSVANNFFSALRQLPKGGDVIFTIDSRSWRKAVEIPNHPGYKSGRTDKDGNKGVMNPETAQKFYGLMDDFGKHLSRVGIIVSRIGGAEGDDLIYRWTKRLYDKGESCIIISGDRDLTQLVKMNKDKDKWIIQWNNKNNGKRFKNSMYVPSGWDGEWLKLGGATSIFNFDIGSDKEDLIKLIRDQDITVEVVHPDEVIMKKILAGDDGDDVPPVWINEMPSKKDPAVMTKVRMTGKKPGVVMEQLSESYSIDKTNYMNKWDDADYMQECAGLVLRLTKDVDGMAERQIVIEAMKRNAQLVWLDEAQLPYNLIAEMDLHIDTMMATNETQKHRWNRKGIFDGTRFDEDAPPTKYDPFMKMSIPDNFQ